MVVVTQHGQRLWGMYCGDSLSAFLILLVLVTKQVECQPIGLIVAFSSRGMPTTCLGRNVKKKA